MNDNPYASPCEFSRETVQTTYDSARDAVCAAVDDYLSDRIKAYDFADRLDEIRRLTADRTVQLAVHVLWHFYSDVEDHLVTLDRRSWNIIQRLVLTLKSNAGLDEVCRSSVHASQPIALATLLIIIAGSLLAWNAWPIYLVLAGLVSMVLHCWRERTHAALEADPWEMWPFTSFAALDRAMQNAPNFRKQQYRQEISDRRLGGIFHVDLGLPDWTACWLIGPILLLLQCFPLHMRQLMVVGPSVHA